MGKTKAKMHIQVTIIIADRCRRSERDLPRLIDGK